MCVPDAAGVVYGIGDGGDGESRAGTTDRPAVGYPQVGP